MSRRNLDPFEAEIPVPQRHRLMWVPCDGDAEDAIPATVENMNAAGWRWKAQVDDEAKE